MWKLLLVCIVMSALHSEASRQPTRKRRNGAYAGGYAGGYASSGSGAGGYTGGYSSGGGGGGGVYTGHGSYAGTGGYSDYDDYDNYAPNFGIIDPYVFHQQLTNHVLAQNYATQQAITGLATSGDAYASADATIDNDDTRIRQQIAAQQAYHDNLNRQNRYRPVLGSSSSSSYNLHRYAPSFAAAAGSIGPNGHRQTAYISPANSASPNIVNRFGSSSSSGGSPGGGYKGVSVSSFSSSNGDGSSRRGAQTTINDNGKVTSYSVHS